MADQPKSTRPPKGNAFRASFLAIIQRPELRAAARTFGETLHSLALEDNLILHGPDRPDSEYARRHLAGATADLRHVLEALRDLVDSPDRIDDTRAEVAAHDARAVLEQVAAKLDATFAETD